MDELGLQSELASGTEEGQGQHMGMRRQGKSDSCCHCRGQGMGREAGKVLGGVYANTKRPGGGGDDGPPRFGYPMSDARLGGGRLERRQQCSSAPISRLTITITALLGLWKVPHPRGLGVHSMLDRFSLMSGKILNTAFLSSAQSAAKRKVYCKGHVHVSRLLVRRGRTIPASRRTLLASLE